MKSDLPYYIALAAAPGIGPAKFKILRKFTKSAREVWVEEPKILIKILGEKTARGFLKYRDSLNPQEYLDKVRSKNIGVLIIEDKNYPKLLKEIADPPPVLYVRGELSPKFFKKVIAVVGTRKMTNYGKEVTEVLVRDLVAAGFTIVSGLAYGVDSYAHRVTIGNGGKTVAVLGGGIDRIYPRENEALAKEIENGNGAVISEFPIGMDSMPGNFPARNRIISGLSHGVLITEAGDRSGSLITAGQAGEQGREVFAVPGPILSKLSQGPSSLIKQGAKLVTNVNDILEELNLDVRYKTEDVSEVEGDNEEEEKIIEIIKSGVTHVDQITRQSKLPAAKVGSTLSLMEIKGKVRSSGSGSYSLTY